MADMGIRYFSSYLKDSSELELDEEYSSSGVNVVGIVACMIEERFEKNGSEQDNHNYSTELLDVVRQKFLCFPNTRGSFFQTKINTVLKFLFLTWKSLLDSIMLSVAYMETRNLEKQISDF